MHRRAAPGRHTRWLPRPRRSRGQALVEFALVIIPFFTILFSVVEGSLIVASIGTYNFAARDAARIGSILGRQNTTAIIDGKIVSDVQAHAQGLVMAKVQEVDIYRAAVDGNCLNALAPAAGSEVSVDASTCIKNQYTATGALVGGTSVLWPTDQRDDQLTTADYLGVRVKYTYTYVTGFIAAFGSTLSFSSTSVQRIEPQEYTGFTGSPDALAMLGSAPASSMSSSAPSILASVSAEPAWHRAAWGQSCSSGVRL